MRLRFARRQALASGNLGMRPFIDNQTCNVHSVKILEKEIQTIILTIILPSVSAATLNPRRRRSLRRNAAVKRVAYKTLVRFSGHCARARYGFRVGFVSTAC